VIDKKKELLSNSNNTVNNIINCVAVQSGNGDSLYIPFIIIATSIKDDEAVKELITELLYPDLMTLLKYCRYEFLHRLYPHYLVIMNMIIDKELLVTSCVDLVFDDEVSFYGNMWEVTFKRFNRIKRTLSKEGTNYYYFSSRNEHIVKDLYSQVDILDKNTHPYMIFVYFWALLLRLEKQLLDSFLYGVPNFTIQEVSKLGLMPRCLLKERTKVVLINAYLKNKLKQCPLWMANNYNLKKH
jgi:hypothetical protein